MTTDGPPPDGAAAVPEASVPAPAPTPRCATHPEADAVGACTRCGSFFCPACKGWEHGQERTCVRCDPGGPYVAWEDRTKLGALRSFTKTLKTLLLSPDRFFLRMPTAGGYGAPIGFAWISWALASVVTAVAYGVLLGGMFAILPVPEGDAAPVGQVIAGFILGSVAAVLVGIIPMLFLWSLLLHVMVRIFGGTGSLEATFRCHAYASGVFALGVIPFIGLSVAQFYWIVLQIFAVKNAHRMSTGRAAAAVLILPILCCGLFVALEVGLFAWTASLSQQQ